VVDPQLLRPADVKTLLGNSSLAKKDLGGAIAPPFVNWFKKW
jgi:GDP-D-mannose dehydratase